MTTRMLSSQTVSTMDDDAMRNSVYAEPLWQSVIGGSENNVYEIDISL